MIPESPASPRSRHLTTWAAGSRRGIAIAAVLTVAAAVVVFLTQVEVATDAGEVRACGSAFDSAVDRSGWEQWWVSDLDDPDPVGESSLPRTRLCPGALNRRTALAGAFGVVGVILGMTAMWRRGPSNTAGTSIEHRVRFLGTVASLVGAGLSVAGIAALVVLVADADATLFRYTDRLVVVVGGLLVLTPAFVLFALGRLVALVASSLERRSSE